MNVLIADDEKIVLEGLKHIIDWNRLGFSICGEASDGEDALHKILSLNPDLVMLDIRMPKKNGIDVVQSATDMGYKGYFIILSGVCDFKLAQAAMRYDVTFYLTKPIDEEELERSVCTVRDSLIKQKQNESFYQQYRTKARLSILQEILSNHSNYDMLNLDELHLSATVYQVILYENYNQDYFHTTWNFGELLRVTNDDNYSFDLLTMEHQHIVLLKGDLAINKFQNMIDHYETGLEKGSPFDSVFLIYGQKVSRIHDVHFSYETVSKLAKRRFFCEENQHVIGFHSNNVSILQTGKLIPENAAIYANQFADYIQSYNQTLLICTLKELSDMLYHIDADVSSIKHFLIDVYILVKQKLSSIYQNMDIPFLSNAAIIELIDGKFYLYEIIAFLSEQFKILTHAVGFSSAENVLDEVLYYIQHNYHNNLKLESIASLFGYNSSYLGKLFTRKTGCSFNTYLDLIRIEASKKLLKDHTFKVYDIADQVGYRNVDYFHKKFKKHVGQSPAEFRKQFSPTL